MLSIVVSVGKISSHPKKILVMQNYSPLQETNLNIICATLPLL